MFSPFFCTVFPGRHLAPLPVSAGANPVLTGQRMKLRSFSASPPAVAGSSPPYTENRHRLGGSHPLYRCFWQQRLAIQEPHVLLSRSHRRFICSPDNFPPLGTVLHTDLQKIQCFITRQIDCYLFQRTREIQSCITDPILSIFRGDKSCISGTLPNPQKHIRPR